MNGDEFGVLTSMMRENGRAATAAIREVSSKIDATNEHLVATNERLDGTADRLDRTNERLDTVVETSAATRERLAKLEGHLLRSVTPPAMPKAPQSPLPVRPKADSTGEIVLPTPAPGQTLELSIGGGAKEKKSVWKSEGIKSALKYGMAALIPALVGVASGWFGHASAAAPVAWALNSLSHFASPATCAS